MRVGYTRGRGELSSGWWEGAALRAHVEGLLKSRGVVEVWVRESDSAPATMLKKSRTVTMAGQDLDTVLAPTPSMKVSDEELLASGAEWDRGELY